MDEVIEKKVKKVKEEISKNENVYSSGVVTSVSSYILEVTGLNDISLYEEVSIKDKANGYVFSIFFDKVVIALTLINEPIMVGDEVVASKHIFKGLFSTDSIGKVVDIYGHDLISNKSLENLANTNILNRPIAIVDRSPIIQELSTGITAIDLLYPINKGQKQLIVGDRGVGKTQIVLDTIVNQKDKNVLCFYVALGKSKREIKEIYYEFTKRGATAYTTIFATFSDDMDTNIYLTPYVVMSIAEHLMKQGYDILIVFDDLTRHGKAYHNINIAINNLDLYPTDIFNVHAKLLESGAQLIDGGSITIMSIVETYDDEVLSNAAAICDGKIVLSKELFSENKRPAIDYGHSLSYIDNNVETSKLSAKIKRKILSFLDIKNVYELSDQELFTEDLKKNYIEGKKILDVLQQYKYSPKSKDEMKSMFHFLDDGGTK